MQTEALRWRAPGKVLAEAAPQRGEYVIQVTILRPLGEDCPRLMLAGECTAEGLSGLAQQEIQRALDAIGWERGRFAVVDVRIPETAGCAHG